MKKICLFFTFLICATFAICQNSEDDGYVIGFDKSDSVYMDFQVLRPEFCEWHTVGTILNELYGMEPKELSEATVICDKKFKVYEGWKLVAEIDLANPKTTIADGKDEFIVYVKYRKGGSESFTDQSSSTTSNVVVINVATADDGVGEKIVTVCYPSSKYEKEVIGDMSAVRIYNLSIHEYPIFVNTNGIPRAFSEAKNLNSLKIYWDAVYMNLAIYKYFMSKGASITPSEKSMLVNSTYNLARCYSKMGIYNKALPYFVFASRNSAEEKYYMECNYLLAECLEKLEMNNADVYDKMILAHQNNPKMDSRSLDFVIKALIARGNIYLAQKNSAKAKECYQKVTAIDTAKRYSAKVAECMERLNKMSN